MRSGALVPFEFCKLIALHFSIVVGIEKTHIAIYDLILVATERWFERIGEADPMVSGASNDLTVRLNAPEAFDDHGVQYV